MSLDERAWVLRWSGRSPFTIQVQETRIMPENSQDFYEDVPLEEEILTMLQNLNGRLERLENQQTSGRYGSSPRRIYNTNRDEDGFVYDYEYQNQPRMTNSSYSNRGRYGYDYEYRGNRNFNPNRFGYGRGEYREIEQERVGHGAHEPQNVGRERLRRIQSMMRGSNVASNYPTLGPNHPENNREAMMHEGPMNQPRAFSAKRFGNEARDPETGIPIDKSGSIDERTREGRLASDDAGISDEQLMEMLESAPRVKDGSIDLRTEQGRALRASGLVDENGWPVEELTGENGEEEEEENPGRSAGRGRRRGMMHHGGK